MPTLAQQRALALVPKFTASLSMTCSSFLIYEVWCDRRQKRSSAIQRVLVGMSVVDICASFGWLLSTWAVPASSGFALATGNQATCNFQGFLLQMAVGAPLYNSSLALFYLMVIKYNWTNPMLVRVEKMVHGAILTFSVGTAILLLPLEQYNHISSVCWVIGEPQGCGHSTNRPSEEEVPCTRGDYAYLYGLALFYGPLWICVLACITSMIIIYREVKMTHHRINQYGRRNQHHMRRSSSDTSLVATQALLYTCSFFVTWMPSTIWSVAYWLDVDQFWLDLLAAVCEPLQGFINMCIFVRRRPQSQQKIRWFLRTIFLCQWSSDEDHDGNDHLGRRSRGVHSGHGTARLSRGRTNSSVQFSLDLSETTAEQTSNRNHSGRDQGDDEMRTKADTFVHEASESKTQASTENAVDDTFAHEAPELKTQSSTEMAADVPVSELYSPKEQEEDSSCDKPQSATDEVALKSSLEESDPLREKSDLVLWTRHKELDTAETSNVQPMTELVPERVNSGPHRLDCALNSPRRNSATF